MTLGLIECYRYREVLWNLLGQELKVRYKRTLLGYLWSLLNPILYLAILSFVFSHFVGREIENYTQYLFAGLLPWVFFQGTLISSATVLLDNETFIKKVYLPKLIFPLSKLAIRATDFLLSFFALAVLGLLIHFQYHATLLLVPLAATLLIAFTLGLGVMISIATVYFRDVQYLLTVALQLLYFATPVLYPIQALPPETAVILRWNPLYWIFNLFHQLVYWGQVPSIAEWLIAGSISVVGFSMGLFAMQKLEGELVFKM